jgi:hypothetical protein
VVTFQISLVDDNEIWESFNGKRRNRRRDSEQRSKCPIQTGHADTHGVWNMGVPWLAGSRQWYAREKPETEIENNCKIHHKYLQAEKKV